MKKEFFIPTTVIILSFALLSCCKPAAKEKTGSVVADTLKTVNVSVLSSQKLVEPQEIAFVRELEDTAGSAALLRDFLSLFNNENTAVPSVMAGKFLYRIEGIDLYLGGSSGENPRSEVETTGQPVKREKYIRVLCKYKVPDQGQTSEVTYLVTLDYGGRVIDTYQVGKKEWNEGFTRFEGFKFLNDTLFFKYNPEADSTPATDMMSRLPEYFSDTDSTGEAVKYLITTNGKIMRVDED